MFTCFICSHSFNSHNSLIIHLKVFHNCTVNSKFLCGQNGCVRSYDNIYTFKRHLVLKHSEEPSTNLLIVNSAQPASLHAQHNNFSNEFPNYDNYASSMETDTFSPACETGDLTDSAFQHAVKNSAAHFISQLYNNNIVTKAHVQDIVTNTTEFLGSGFITIIKNEVLKIISNSNVDKEKVSKIESMFKVLENPFSELQTEYKRLKYFSESGFLIKPDQFVIGQSLQSRLSNNVQNIQPTLRTGQVISLRKLFKCYFEIPGVLDTILSYIEDLKNSNVLSNFMQGSLWKNMSLSFSGKLMLPLFLHFDDFETNNPLGSHAGTHKVGAVYVSLPCIPLEFRSALKNIFLAMLFYSTDRSDFGNPAVFQVLINELDYLYHTGISIQVNQTTTQLHFALSLILGDNLGVNSVLGFTESFSAKFPCRFCKANKETIRVMCSEDIAILRTVENYSLDVKNSSLQDSGIKEESIWNTLPNFHIILNSSCDIMHDLYEGVCRYDMSHIILHYLDFKLFTLETLNNRISYYDFGPVEINNKPPNITMEKLKSKTLGFSASEMLCFVRNFALIVGDLVPLDDDIWQFYLTLCQIVNLTSLVAVQPESVYLLQTLIQEHNEQYISLFKDTLKPKHHFLLHYPSLILNIGPLAHVSSMRFEAKHKDFKQAAHVSACRINLPYTLAYKHQLKMCYRFHTKEGLVLDTKTGPCDQINLTDLLFDLNMTNNPPMDLLSCCFKVSWVKIGGILYKPSLAVVINDYDYLPCFVRIGFVLMNEDRDVYLLAQSFNTLCFETHYNSFEVDIQNEWQLISVHDLKNPNTAYCRKLPNGRSFISVR